MNNTEINKEIKNLIIPVINNWNTYKKAAPFNEMTILQKNELNSHFSKLESKYKNSEKIEENEEGLLKKQKLLLQIGLEISKFNTGKLGSPMNMLGKHPKDAASVMNLISSIDSVIKNRDFLIENSPSTQEPKEDIKFKSLISKYENKIKSLEATLKNQNDILEATEREFNSINHDIDHKLTLLFDDSKKNFNEKSTKFLTKIEGMELNAKTKSDGILNTLESEKENLETNLKKFNRLTGILAGEIQAQEHSYYAKQEKKNADNFRYAAIITLLAGLLVGIDIVYNFDPQGTAQAILMKFGLILAFGIPTTYFARESQKHRTLQHHYRKIDLDLKSIDPYSSSLEPNQQNELKMDIANKIFGQKSENIKQSYPIDIQELALEAIKTAKNNLKTNNKSTSE